MEISWSRELGTPTKPGSKMVPGIGAVRVLQEDINRANAPGAVGGDLNVELIEVTSHSSTGREFILGPFSRP